MTSGHAWTTVFFAIWCLQNATLTLLSCKLKAWNDWFDQLSTEHISDDMRNHYNIPVHSIPYSAAYCLVRLLDKNVYSNWVGKFFAWYHLDGLGWPFLVLV